METVSADKRLQSLDAFRGLTIAAMLLVNNPGTWGHIYAPLEHARWHGCTPTDLIFPFFLFIVGTAMSFSFSKRKIHGADTGKLMIHILRRSAIIFVLGLIPTLLFKPDLTTLRIPGVLQRIAVCYLFASVIILKTGTKGRIIAGTILLAAYWIIVKLVPVPGYGAGDLSFEGNIIGYVDTLLLKRHLYKEAFDPEGIISTLPAIVTVLLGIFTGDWIRSNADRIKVTKGLLLGGMILTAAGLLWSAILPLNKKLWTDSYIFFTGGLVAFFLGICYWLIDVKGYRKWSFPAIVYGMNAITAFVGSGIMARILIYWRFTGSDGSRSALKTIIYKNIFEPLGPAKFTSLLFAVSFVLVWYGIMDILYRKKIFLKV